MTRGNLPLTLDQGSRFVFQLTYNGVDMTSWGLRMIVRPDFDDTEKVLSLSVNNGLVWVDAATGKFNIDISATLMAKVDGGEYVYDLKVIPGGDESLGYLLVGGTFTVNEAATP